MAMLSLQAIAPIRYPHFGARGANSGLQDVDNLSWKLAHVIKGLAPTPCWTAMMMNAFTVPMKTS